MASARANVCTISVRMREAPERSFMTWNARGDFDKEILRDQPIGRYREVLPPSTTKP